MQQIDRVKKFGSVLIVRLRRYFVDMVDMVFFSVICGHAAVLRYNLAVRARMNFLKYLQ